MLRPSMASLLTPAAALCSLAISRRRSEGCASIGLIVLLLSPKTPVICRRKCYIVCNRHCDDESFCVSQIRSPFSFPRPPERVRLGPPGLSREHVTYWTNLGWGECSRDGRDEHVLASYQDLDEGQPTCSPGPTSWSSSRDTVPPLRFDHVRR